MEYTQEMVRDQYGNYVIQYVVDLKNMDVNGRIVDKLKGTILELSNEKFSSNVIEKVCFWLCNKSIVFGSEHVSKETGDHNGGIASR